MVCDVSKESDVKAMVDRAVEKWGRLDVMVRLLISLDPPADSLNLEL